MINLKITGRNYELSDKIVEYTNRKIGQLDKYLPRGNYAGTIVLSIDPSGREDNQCVCEGIIKVPGPDLQSKEATINMYAAVDIVAAKLKAQATRHKDKHSPRSRRGRIFVSKLLHRDDSTPPV